MSCDLSSGRKVPCKDNLGSIQNVYFCDFDDLSSFTLTADEVTDAAASGAAISLYKYELKGANSLETNIVSSPDNGTTFFESTLNLVLHKLTKEDNVQIKLLSFSRPRIIVQDMNNNFFLVGKEHGCSVSSGTAVTGAGFGDMAGYTLGMSASEPLLPNFISGATEANPFAGLSTVSGITTVVVGTNS
tara:strand:+ start:50 stop:613 length:564 start_codon:yes stop_codon:yes gene_type:complete